MIKFKNQIRYFHPRFNSEYFYSVSSPIFGKILFNSYLSKYFGFETFRSSRVNRTFAHSNKFSRSKVFRFSDYLYSVTVNTKDDTSSSGYLEYLIFFYLARFTKLISTKFNSKISSEDQNLVEEELEEVFRFPELIVPYFLVYSKNFLIANSDFNFYADFIINQYLRIGPGTFFIIYFFKRLYTNLFKSLVVI